MSEPLENGATHSEEKTEELSDAVNPSPPPSDTLERVEDLLDKVETYNSVIPDAVTKNILESSGVSNCSPDVSFLFVSEGSFIFLNISGDAPNFSGCPEVHLRHLIRGAAALQDEGRRQGPEEQELGPGQEVRDDQ